MNATSSSKEVGTTPGQQGVPLKHVVPWWYVVGAVATIVGFGLLDAGGTAAAAFWGPTIGMSIRDRLATAKQRQPQGRPLSRREMVGPYWLEPLLAVLFTLFVIGLGLALGFVFGHGSLRTLWSGVALIAAAGLGTIGLFLVQRRRKERHRSDVHHQAVAE